MAKPLARTLKSIVVRTYTLALLLLVVWTAYTAVAYLYRSVFTPASVPAWLLDWSAHFEAANLRAEHVPGISQGAQRAPMGHYHNVDRWFQPDPRNGCTAGGCHEPLPHSKSRERRAFANLHTTFLACEVCHVSAAGPAPAVWVASATGQPQGVPPMLKLLGLLETRAAELENDSAALRTEVLGLLRQSLDVLGGEPVLDQLYVRLNTAESGSPVWRTAMRQLVEELPSHARGEYGAKVALAPGATSRPATDAGQIGDYFEAPVGSNERRTIHASLHAGVVSNPRGCAPCHGGEGGRLDFAELGYSPARVKALTSSRVAALMQQIQEGREFEMPRFMEGGDGR